MLSQLWQKESKTFLTYDDILLKDYINIARTGDFSLLILSGKPTQEECLEAWEQIVKRDSKESGSFQYNNYFGLYKAYATLLTEHILVRSCLMKLTLIIDWECIKIVRKKGYKIDTTNSQTYLESLNASLKRSENLVTRIRMKQKEMETEIRSTTSNTNPASFEQVVANLNYALGFTVQDNIKLSAYNEYKKILKRKTAIQKARV